MTPPVLDLDAMRKTAEAATPGAWDGRFCSYAGLTDDPSSRLGFRFAPARYPIADLKKVSGFPEVGKGLIAEACSEEDRTHIAAWSPANAIAVLDRLRDAEVALGANTGVDCCVCGQRIFGSMRGMGDGSGQAFDHDSCYWRTRAEKAEARVAEVERVTRELHHIADVIEPHWKGAGLPLESAWILSEILGDRKEVTDERDEAETRATAAETALATERETVARLREAIDPFAKLYPHPDEPDHWPAFGKATGQDWPTTGDFRRAARVLASIPEPSAAAPTDARSSDGR